MALNIDGTTGISGVDGSASAPALQGTDSNTGINFGSDTVNINTGGVTRATVDSSGTVNIGSTGYGGGGASPILYLRSTSGRQMKIHNTASDTCGIQLSNNATGEGDDAGFQLAVLSTGDGFINNPQSKAIRFSTANTERMRITSAGKLQYNNTTDMGAIFQLTADGVTNLSAHDLAKFNYNSPAAVTAIEMRHGRGGLSGFSGKMISFTGNDGTEEGSVVIGTTNTAFNTSSDYRLKENETSISNPITKLKTLKPYTFNFKKDPDVKVDGFFAHEVAPVVPVAVTGEKDAMEAETRYEEGDTIPEGKVIGDPKTFSTTKISPQQLDQSKLVPLLTAALQEAVAKIEVLETKVAALEAA